MHFAEFKSGVQLKDSPSYEAVVELSVFSFWRFDRFVAEALWLCRWEVIRDYDKRLDTSCGLMV